MPCVVRAIDISFKISMVLNALYTFEARNVYLFVQRYIYEIVTKFDNMTSSIYNLIGEMKKD